MKYVLIEMISMPELSFGGLDIGVVEPGDYLVDRIGTAVRTDRRADSGVIVRRLEYEDGEGIPNVGGLIRRRIGNSIALTARIKAGERF